MDLSLVYAKELSRINKPNQRLIIQKYLENPDKNAENLRCIITSIMNRYATHEANEQYPPEQPNLLHTFQKSSNVVVVHDATDNLAYNTNWEREIILKKPLHKYAYKQKSMKSVNKSNKSGSDSNTSLDTTLSFSNVIFGSPTTNINQESL